MVAEAVQRVQEVVELRLAEGLPGRDARPDHPQAGFLHAALAGPAQEQPFAVKEPHQPRQPGRVHGLRQRLGRNRLHDMQGAGAQVLEVLVAAGARQHIQQFDMTGGASAIGQLAAERARERRDVAHMKGQEGLRHDVSSHAPDPQRDRRWSPTSDSAREYGVERMGKGRFSSPRGAATPG
ncbi:MAG: hypothetical protein A2051_04625 [Desulfovibrionales bacterium GWA2_65_9]|nr:MAG: hypothetical protein A2051_04625 [Desulfovibrionales bacterium GWA2_65_9]